MFDSRIKKFLSVVLSSCTLGCLTSFFACNAEDVSPNNGTWTDSDLIPSAENEVKDGEFAVMGQSSLDGYLIKGNTISFGEKSHLLSYECVAPSNCDLYLRAVKVKDAFGDDIPYNPNTNDTFMDSGWLLYKGTATFDYLAGSAGIWQTFAVRYSSTSADNDFGVVRVVKDESRSTDGIDRFTLLDKDNKVISPDVPSPQEESGEIQG